MSQPPNDDHSKNNSSSQKTPFERGRFGGSIKPPKMAAETPISKSDLGKRCTRTVTNQDHEDQLECSDYFITCDCSVFRLGHIQVNRGKFHYGIGRQLDCR